MKITSLMITTAMSLDLKARKKDQVIDELIELLVKSNRVSDRKRFKNDILNREKLGTTGIGEGIAIPHAKSKYVIAPTLAFGVSRNGIDYQSLDGELVKIIFMIAVPESGGNLHLEALSTLARLLIYDEFKEGLYNVKSIEEALALIDKAQLTKEEDL